MRRATRSTWLTVCNSGHATHCVCPHRWQQLLGFGLQSLEEIAPARALLFCKCGRGKPLLIPTDSLKKNRVQCCLTNKFYHIPLEDPETSLGFCAFGKFTGTNLAVVAIFFCSFFFFFFSFTQGTTLSVRQLCESFIIRQCVWSKLVHSQSCLFKHQTLYGT